MDGAATVAEFFKGKAHSCVPGLVDGDVGLMVRVNGRMLFVVELTFSGGRIATMDAVAERDAIESLELVELEWGAR